LAVRDHAQSLLEGRLSRQHASGTALGGANAEAIDIALREQSAEARQLFVDIRQMCQCLSPSQQEILLLIAVDGLSYEEAAVVCKISLSSVKSSLADARAELHKALIAEQSPKETKPGKSYV
jgi:RNA polymerase sigma factor (sigma-70 family)